VSDDEDTTKVLGVAADAPIGQPPAAPEEGILIRHEEAVVDVDKTWRGIGLVRGRKRVDSHLVRELIPRGVENVLLERTPPNEDDSGRIETLPDGSISIPVYEEELVITKRIVLRERVIVRKETVVREERVEAELRRERVEVEGDDGVVVADERGGDRRPSAPPPDAES
jgi:uncharacterized protein (TIGR02271 family)